MRRLTFCRNGVHTVSALDASRAGRENPRFNGAPAPTIGRYFFARCFTMAAWAGQASAWPVSVKPVSHPRSSRRPTAVRSGRVGSNPH